MSIIARSKNLYDSNRKIKFARKNDFINNQINRLTKKFYSRLR